MRCDSYQESSDNCRYFEMLKGTGEDLPTGCDPDTGRCKIIEDDIDWLVAGPEDCDMIDLDDQEI